MGFRNPYRFAFDRANGDLILADVGQNNIEEINRIVLGGNYGWAIKEGDVSVQSQRRARSVRRRATQSRQSGRPDRSDLRPAGHAAVRPRRRHLDHRRLRVSRHGNPGAGRQVRVRRPGAPQLAAARRRPAVLCRPADRALNEFLLPQFTNGILPNGLTVHGFGEDGNGELYALVTNTPANGTGGIVYKLTRIPEPAAVVLLLTALAGGAFSIRRRTR